MPELDGLQMIQCIRAINPSVKTIYMSGELDKYHTELQQEVAEFDARVLPKPFTKGDLIGQLTAERCGATQSDLKTLNVRAGTKEG
jgi:YesN/AraC family two-component response regulator